MTRSVFLKSMLHNIFGFISFSVEDNKINKGAENSMYHNCNYTVKSYNDFVRFFKIAFISEAPKYSDNSDFNRSDVVLKAKKYLEDYEISIPDYLSDEEERQLIYYIFGQYILQIVVINSDGENKKEAETADITSVFLSTIQTIQNYIIRTYALTNTNALIPRYTPFTDTDYESFPDKCNFSFKFNIDPKVTESIIVLNYLRKIELAIPEPYEKRDFSTIDNIYDIISSGVFSCKKQSLQTYKHILASFFTDEKEFDSKTHFLFQTYVDEADIIKDTKGHSRKRILYDYVNSLRNKAKNQLEQRINIEIKPLYENNRTYLERMIRGIVIFNAQDKKLLDKYMNTGDKEVAYKILFDKCYQLFWNFNLSYLYIEQAYHGNVDLGMYLLLQDFILELTEILNSHGEEIAKQFKKNLSDDSFKAHKKSIQKYYDPASDRFKKAIEFESAFSKNHQERIREPKTVEDLFKCIRTGTYSSFQSALYKYYLHL